MAKTGDGAFERLDLESDSLLDTLRRNQRQLTIGAIVLALGVGGGWMWVRYGQIRESKAAAALVDGESAFAAGNPELARTELEKVIQRYAGTSAGTQAVLLSAQINFEGNQVEAGMATLAAAGAKAPRHLKAAVLSMEAAGHALQGRPAESAAAYEKAASFAQFRAEAEQFQMEAAKQHVAAGNVAAARALYQTISEREDSGNAGEARVRLGELVVKS
jgi:predicted negative regulator of RcsB-dependent stress response